MTPPFMNTATACRPQVEQATQSPQGGMLALALRQSSRRRLHTPHRGQTWPASATAVSSRAALAPTALQLVGMLLL